MYRFLIQAHTLCHPVLGNSKAVHAEYFDVRVHLGGGTKIGDVAVHCPSGPADGLSDIRRTEPCVFGIYADGSMSGYINPPFV